ncbi:MAG: group III truncated hemoglobin [Agriterribacter sp.]
MKPDITSEEDIKKLVDSFYKKVIVDPAIGFIFTEVVALSWDKHIPIMYSFWSSVLLGAKGYNGNPMQQHIQMDKQVHFEQHHFDRWLGLWAATVRENFEGRVADEAISRANNIGALMLFKIQKNRTGI